METIFIEATSTTPEVNIDAYSGIFSFSGKSYPENVNDFYTPIFELIDRYKKKPAKSTILELNWLYYNTATSKIIIKLIQHLKDLSPVFKVKWYCKDNFELMIEKGEEIKEVLEIDLEIIYI